MKERWRSVCLAVGEESYNRWYGQAILNLVIVF